MVHIPATPAAGYHFVTNGVEDEGDGFVVKVTDAKLAESFGHALEKAYAGKLDSPPTTSEKENLVRVHWSRD